MWSWLAKKIIDRQLARLRAGDYRPLLRLYADEVRFVFPGDSSWSGEFRGKGGNGPVAAAACQRRSAELRR